jgi:hypothetical protein
MGGIREPTRQGGCCLRESAFNRKPQGHQVLLCTAKAKLNPSARRLVRDAVNFEIVATSGRLDLTAVERGEQPVGIVGGSAARRLEVLGADRNSQAGPGNHGQILTRVVSVTPVAELLLHGQENSNSAANRGFLKACTFCPLPISKVAIRTREVFTGPHSSAHRMTRPTIPSRADFCLDVSPLRSSGWAISLQLLTMIR